MLRALRKMQALKKAYLGEEAEQLSNVCRLFAQHLQLEQTAVVNLVLAAHLKGAGLLYVGDRLLEQNFDQVPFIELRAAKGFSVAVAKAAGWAEVAEILEHYGDRTIPVDPLAQIFQVCNCWVMGRSDRKYSPAQERKECRIELNQRATMKWSDPDIVKQFIDWEFGMEGT